MVPMSPKVFMSITDDLSYGYRMGSHSIAVCLIDEGVPTQIGKLLWLQSHVHHVLGNDTYTRTWVYEKFRHVSTEDGMKIYDQSRGHLD